MDGDCSLNSSGLDKFELGQRRDAVVQTDFLSDLAILETQDRGADEMHLPSVAPETRASLSSASAPACGQERCAT